MIEAGAINKLPELLAGIYSGKKEEICIICDENTYTAAGKIVEDILEGCKIIKLSPVGLHADNHGVMVAEELLEDQIKLILAKAFSGI